MVIYDKNKTFKYSNFRVSLSLQQQYKIEFEMTFRFHLNKYLRSDNFNVQNMLITFSGVSEPSSPFFLYYLMPKIGLDQNRFDLNIVLGGTCFELENGLNRIDSCQASVVKLK